MLGRLVQLEADSMRVPKARGVEKLLLDVHS